MFVYTPVIEKLWKQHEIWDGTYTLDDLLDIHEALWIKNKTMHLLIKTETEQMDDWR